MKSDFPTITKARLRKLLSNFASQRVMVIGDVMIDQYISGRCGRISPEAPVPVVDVTREDFVPGGAANTARNLQSLGAMASVMGVVGTDSMGDRLDKMLTALGIGTEGLLEDDKRHTTIKTRIVAQHQQIVRYDRETRTELPDWLTKLALDHLHEAIFDLDAVVVADYAKGFVTQQLYNGIVRVTKATNKVMAVDPKPQNYIHLRDMTVATPNRSETFAAAGINDRLAHHSPLHDGPLMHAGEILMRRWRPKILVMTLGERGMCLLQKGKRPAHIPTVAREVFDVSGAGDTVIAAYALALAAGATAMEAAIIANHAAGVVVGKFGTATATQGEILESFERDE